MKLIKRINMINQKFLKQQRFPDLYLALCEYRKCRAKKITLINSLLQIAYNPDNIGLDKLQKMLNFDFILPEYLQIEVNKVKNILGVWNNAIHKS